MLNSRTANTWFDSVRVNLSGVLLVSRGSRPQLGEPNASWTTSPVWTPRRDMKMGSPQVGDPSAEAVVVSDGYSWDSGQQPSNSGISGQFLRLFTHYSRNGSLVPPFICLINHCNG